VTGGGGYFRREGGLSEKNRKKIPSKKDAVDYTQERLREIVDEGGCNKEQEKGMTLKESIKRQAPENPTKDIEEGRPTKGLPIPVDIKKTRRGGKRGRSSQQQSRGGVLNSVRGVYMTANSEAVLRRQSLLGVLGGAMVKVNHGENL